MLPVTRNDAISVSSSSATCETDEPKIAGSISCPIFFTPASSQRQRGRRSRPSFTMAGSWKASCTAPATNTPTESTTPGCSKRGAIHAANTIITRFISVDISAGTVKRW